MRLVVPVPLLMLGGLFVLDAHFGKVCEAQTRASALAPEWQHRGDTKAALLGDSWAVGDGTYPAFPALLADTLHLDLRVSAVGGTGYLNGGACGGQNFATRVDTVPTDAQIVFLAGGLNDSGEVDNLTEEASAVAAAVLDQAPGAKIVVFGVPRVPLLDDEQTARADQALRSTDGVIFLDVREWEIPTLPDRIHPTAEGQREYAELLVAAIGSELR